MKEKNNNETTKIISDEQALFDHYQTKHEENLKEIKMELAKAYYIIFVEKPSKYNLDIAEKFWMSKLQSTINVIKSNLPTCEF